MMLNACANYDSNVRDYADLRQVCGWQLIAHTETWNERAGRCSVPDSSFQDENPSRFNQYRLACVALARCKEVLSALWKFRLKDGQFPRIDHKYDRINEPAQAAFDVVRRIVQVEASYLYRYCAPDPYNTGCEEDDDAC